MSKYNFSIEYSPQGNIENDSKGTVFLDNYLHISQTALLPFNKYENTNYFIFIWGTLISNGKIISDIREININNLVGLKNYRNHNGSFILCIYNKTDKSLVIVNDRFGSLPLFSTYNSNKYYFSSSFKYLFDTNNRKVNEMAIFEFVYFRRLFGDKTYDDNIKYIPFATIIKIEKITGICQSKYWVPEYNKKNISKKEYSNLLANAIKKSVELYTSDNKKNGLMLSGGLDARAILASTNKPIHCYTTAPENNNEVNVAKLLAHLKNVEHTFIKRPKNLLNNVLDDSVFLSGGMTVYSEMQFSGYSKYINEDVDIIFLGLALDIMFCGHYLPKKNVNILGRPGLFFKLDNLDKVNLTNYFIENISYKLKTSDPYSIVNQENVNDIKEYLVNSVDEILNEGRTYGAENYDLWEFMHLHNFSRHYSFLMASSIRTYADCRIPAIENSLLDLCNSMPVSYKYNWQVYQKAIQRLDPSMMNIRNSNTNMNASYSLYLQTAIKILRSASNRIMGTNFHLMPSWCDRSWPHPSSSIRDNPDIMGMVKSLKNSQKLASLSYINMDLVREILSDHLNHKYDHTVIINCLLTIDKTL